MISLFLKLLFVSLTAFYDKTILESYFKISLDIMNITNYSWWYETLNQVIFQNWIDCYVDAQTDLINVYKIVIYLLCLLVHKYFNLLSVMHYWKSYYYKLMSLAQFASVLFKARMIILYVLLSISHVQYEQVYWIYFCLFSILSRHPISFL